MNLNNILDTFQQEEINAKDLVKGHIFNCDGKWKIVHEDIKTEDYNHNTKCIEVITECYAYYYFYSKNEVFENVKIINHNVYDINLIISMIEIEKEEARIQEKEMEKEYNKTEINEDYKNDIIHNRNGQHLRNRSKNKTH